MDVPDGTGIAASNWSTQLVLTMGAGGEHFSVLDVTDPSDCSSVPCALNTYPFELIADSSELGATLPTYIGETWSIPALYLDNGTVGYSAKASFGSGYEGSSSGDNSYYNYFATLWDKTSLSAHLLAGTGAKVDYAVFANPAAVLDPSTFKVEATYQADLAGRITRYVKGFAGSYSHILNFTWAHPLYFSPAAYRRDSGAVVLAVASGNYFEEGSGGVNWMTDPLFTSKIFLRREQGGTVDASGDTLTCAIDDICSCADIENPLAGCSAPSDRAVPVSSALIVQDRTTGSALNTYFLYYDPPPDNPNSCGAMVGDSWVIQIQTDGATQSLKMAKKYEDTFISGLSVVGGGTEIALIKSGIGKGAQASTETVSGNVAMPAPKAPRVEVWREVR